MADDSLNQARPKSLRLQKLVPQDALDYLTNRSIKIDPIFNSQELWQEEYARQFTVSRLTNMDLMQAINDELLKNMQEGGSLRDFQKTLIPKLQAAGWWGVKEVIDQETGEILKTKFNPARLKLIYDTNMSMAYMAGKWARAQRNKAFAPYLVYETMRDERVRKSHQAWEGVALPVDDPWWDTHYPPNGWMCRCSVFSADEKTISRLIAAGKKIKREAPEILYTKHVNKVTGEITQLPAGVDAGFAYNVGKAAINNKAFVGVAMQKLTKADAMLAAMTFSELAALRKQIDAVWKTFLNETTIEAYHAKNAAVAVDVLSVETIKNLTELGVEIESAVNLVRDRELMHAWRNTVKPDATLPHEILLNLPDYLQEADLYLDTKDLALIYAIAMPDKNLGKAVFAFNYQIKTNQKHAGKKVYKAGNVFRTGGKLEDHNLKEKLPSGRLRYLKLRK